MYYTIKTATGPEVQLDMSLLDRYLQLLGSDVRVFLPFFESDPGANAELTDYGPKKHPWVNETALDNDPYLQGSVLAYDLNGTDEAISLPDDGDFTFGNGTADSAFSLGAWVNMVDSTTSVIISREDLTTGATNREWILILESNDYPRFQLIDDSVPATIGREDQTALTQDIWHFIVGTYDATEANTGVKVYVDGVQTDDANSSSGTYVAMEDKAVVTAIGYQEGTGGTKEAFFDGRMWGPFITAQELSAGAVKKLYDLGKIIMHL